MTDPEQLEQRLRDAQSLLERAEKLAVVGGIVHEVAHEINTPLAGLRSNTDLMALSIGRLHDLVRSSCGEGRTPAELEELFSVIDDSIRTNRLACERILSIVEILRAAARSDESGFARANIQPEIENALALLGSALKNRIRLIRDYGALPEIECNPGRLNQVFLNILVNAVQAIEGEGEIRIQASQEGDTVRVAITDNGKGIPAELHTRIFEPGFTTKDPEKGTGLGLAICRRIVHQHGGSIGVDSETGKGTTFTIVLPVHQRERKTDDR